MTKLHSLARDFRRMGIEVIFLNEVDLGFEVPEIGTAFLIAGIFILVVAVA